MIIDCHAHLTPPSLLEAIRRYSSKFPSVRLVPDEESLGFSFVGGAPTRPVAKGLYDIPARLRWMDEQNISRQVCGAWLDMFGNELPPAEGASWSRLMNEHLMEASRREPRFIPLACAPTQDGLLAAQVLHEASKDDFHGVMIGTQPKGVGGVLDDPYLEPFWRAADDLGFVVFIHPVFESGDSRVHDYGLANAVGRITDTMIAISRLIYAGHVERYRNIKFVVGIGGAALPYVIGRLRRNYMIDRARLADPDAALASLYYDTLLHDISALRYLAETVGTQHLMMGSDMPFPIGDPEPIKIVDAAGFGSTERESILGNLAQALFQV